MNFDYRSKRVVVAPTTQRDDLEEKKKKNYNFSQATGLEDVEFAMVHNNMMANNIYRDMGYPVKNGVGVCTCGGGGVGYTSTHNQQEELEPGTCCETDCTDCGTVDCGDECIIL